MPFTATSGSNRLGVALQKMLVGFPQFHGKQAAQGLNTPEILQRRPWCVTQLQAGMLGRPAVETAKIIDAVILQADDVTELISRLQVPAIAIMGESDYVGPLLHISSNILLGVHVTPHESPEESSCSILGVVRLAEKQAVSG